MAKRLDTGRRAGLCAAALSLAALAQGCTTPSVDEVAAQPAALLSRPAPARPAAPAQAAPAAESPLPPPKGFVSDSAGVIDDLSERLLEEKLKSLKARAKIEIGVATVETTGGRDIFDYSLAVARGWGIGPPAGQGGGGILLLLAVKDRKWQIQVSRSLEADLPDDVAGEIGRGMTSALRAGRYGQAVEGCVDGLIKRLADRRGFPLKDNKLILQALPEEKPEASGKPGASEKPGDSEKSKGARRRKP